MKHVALIQHCPDSFAFIASLPADSIDVTITDPPFSAHVQDNQVSGTSMKKWVNGEIQSSGIPKLTLPFAPLSAYTFAADLVQASRRWSVVWCAVEDFGEFKRAVTRTTPRAGKSDVVECDWVRGGLWGKPNACGQLTGDRPAACYEGIAIMHGPTKKTWNGRGSYGLWICNGTRGEKNRHPNQKPLDLCLKLVALFSNRGETVFDPFCGSGRIGEACAMLGRSYLGLDSDPTWVQVANSRFEAGLQLPMDDETALAKCRFKKADILESED